MRCHVKRSRINQVVAEAGEVIRSHGFALPPFAHWSPEVLRARAPGSRIREARLGWDVTDYGRGDFDALGLALFTLRNGSPEELSRGGGMCYAEKLLISRRDQLSPMHTHRVKTEDIINRAGATLAVRLHGSDGAEGFAEDRGGTVTCDGVPRPYGPGEVLRLAAGESVTLRPGDWHAFWGEGGDVLIGEVSTVNDDLTDNVFVEPLGRFSEIEEDEPPLRLLVSDYDAHL